MTPGEGADDRIDFSRSDADSTRSGNQGFDFIGDDRFDDSGQLRVRFSDDDTVVYANTDDDSASEFALVLSGRLTLDAADFIA